MAKKSKRSAKPVPNLTLEDLFPLLNPNDISEFQEKANRVTSKVVALVRRRPATWRVDTLPFSAKLVSAIDYTFPLHYADCVVLHLVHKNLLNLRKQGKLYTKAQPGLRTAPK